MRVKLIPEGPRIPRVRGGAFPSCFNIRVIQQIQCYFGSPPLGVTSMSRVVEQCPLAEFAWNEVARSNAEQADGLPSGIGSAHELAGGGADGGGVRCRNRQ